MRADTTHHKRYRPMHNTRLIHTPPHRTKQHTHTEKLWLGPQDNTPEGKTSSGYNPGQRVAEGPNLTP